MRNVLLLFFVLCFISPLMHGYHNSWHPDETEYLLALVEKLEAGENIIFTKFGDGEYNCMVGAPGHQCDGDYYHAWLGLALKKSLIGLSKKPNVYIGRWHGPDVPQYCDALAKICAVTIPWTSYHLVLNNNIALQHDYMYKLVKFIVNSPKKKILICNQRNSRLKDFFRADVLITIPPTNWSFHYNTYKEAVEKHAANNCIILIAGGMCSKVLINDITDKFDLTFIDVGSGFDLLGGKLNSRMWPHTYEDELEYYKDFIPENWDLEQRSDFIEHTQSDQ